MSSSPIMASPNSFPPAPWIVAESLKYQGRHYFYNPESNESRWTLNVKNDKESKRCDERRCPDDDSLDQRGAVSLPSIQLSGEFHVPRDVGRTFSVGASASSSVAEMSPLLPRIFKEGGTRGGWTSANEEQGARHTLGAEDKSALTQSSARDDEASEEAVPVLRPEDLVVVGGLGHGGFGVVVEVEARPRRADEGRVPSEETSSKHPRERFAMKCLSKHAHSKPESFLRLKCEIEVLTTLPPSRFLLRSVLAFETTSSVFLVTELLGGSDLFFQLDLITRRGLSGFEEPQCVAILAEVCLGLVHLHRRGFVHMDMKIENLMLDSQGHVRIVDFGLAVKIPPDAAAAAAATTTTTTTATAATATHEDSGQDGQRRGGGFPIDAVGSLMSAAPELLLGKDEGRVGGCFSDWWAVGVLAHDLLTGKSPWSSLIKKDVIRQEIKTRHVQISKSSVSLAARQFVEGILAKDWRERLGTRSSDEVLASLFFEGVDWGAVERGDTPPVLGTKPGDREFPSQPRELGFALDEYKQKRRMASAAAGALPSRSSSLDPNPMSVGLLYVAKPPPVFASR